MLCFLLWHVRHVSVITLSLHTWLQMHCEYCECVLLREIALCKCTRLHKMRTHACKTEVWTAMAPVCHLCWHVCVRVFICLLAHDVS